MLTSPDFRELLKLFEKHKIRYLVVGGYAVMKYSEPRFTRDLDVFIATDQDNANGVYAALKEFGAPLENLTPDDFAHKGHFYQMGRPPLRIDMRNNWMYFDEKYTTKSCLSMSIGMTVILHVLPKRQQQEICHDTFHPRR
jgi:hypothetical protein